MASAPRYLIDTNVLLRLSRREDARHELVSSTVERLGRQGSELFFSLQNIAEFWNVCTRPAERNGFGLDLAETVERVQYIERTMTFLPDNGLAYSAWRQLVIDHNVRGVQVHDAHLVAIMKAYGLNHILTLNQQDFLRYPGIQALHPSQIQTSPR
jgi:predicted nucleic acid-binding protein